MTITEPAKELPVSAEADVCVVGGSCTGLFAAVRAARLGKRVVLVEAQNGLGGTACGGLVHIWHSLYDDAHRQQVIAGLTGEVLERLERRGALYCCEQDPTAAHVFNPNELKILLDEICAEHNIRLMLHTYYAGLVSDGEKLTHIFVENKDGRSAIRADFFIDATGDGDLCRDLGLECYRFGAMQPPTSVFFLQGQIQSADLASLIRTHGREFGLDDDWGWWNIVPGLEGITMRADNHVFGVDCSHAEELTRAEVEGRRLAGAFTRLMQTYVDPKCGIAALAGAIGIRDTTHYVTRFRATERALLTGERYEDAIANGTYRVDIHHQEDNGITFKYLSGKTETFYGKEDRRVEGSWREELEYSGIPALYYQVPFSLLVQEKYNNFIPVGRMLHADAGAFGALRVMVNLNQLGEAAGTAASLCLDGDTDVRRLDGRMVRETLQKGGSVC